jgi:hypothetical protein
MAESFYKLSNAEFVIWMKNMVETIGANIADTGLEQTLLDESTALNTNLTENLVERRNLEDALAGKNEEIKFNRRAANKKASLIQGALKINTSIPDSLIEQSGFNVDDRTKSQTAPNPPADLVVTGTSDGSNRLKWKRAGNRHGILFAIEAKIGSSAEWILVDVVTTSKYIHKNQTPGVKIQYRIRARRGNTETTSSNVAVVYE